ncbi:MAG: RNA-binding protein [Oscillospiraceae bacterium]|nr:RNA-binding protein [Oscillospiraceae bacterium]
MDKRALLDRTGAEGEERALLAQVLDRMEHAQRRQEPSCTAFLSPREQLDAQALLNAAGHPRYLPLGGYADAERRALLFLPDWQEESYVDPADYLSALRCTWFREDSLTHRDFLGALMGMGVRRDTVGDILVGEGSCDLIVLPTVAGFLADSMTAAGRVKLHIEPIPLSELNIPVPQRKVLHDTVAALRLDSVAAVGFSISRSKASQYIAQGRVAVNWRETTKADLTVAAGDVISCRGLGKCRLTEVGGLSRKGRINVTLERYL